MKTKSQTRKTQTRARAKRKAKLGESFFTPVLRRLSNAYGTDDYRSATAWICVGFVHDTLGYLPKKIIVRLSAQPFNLCKNVEIYRGTIVGGIYHGPEHGTVYHPLEQYIIRVLKLNKGQMGTLYYDILPA